MVLRAVAGHATDAVQELVLLREACDLPAGSLQERLLLLVTGARRSLVDRLLPKQMSYRARLLELRRGVDVVRLMRTTSLVAGYLEIADWCDAWLAVRGPLMELASDELSWFAENPTRAMSRVSSLALA